METTEKNINKHEHEEVSENMLVLQRLSESLKKIKTCADVLLNSVDNATNQCEKIEEYTKKKLNFYVREF